MSRLTSLAAGLVLALAACGQLGGLGTPNLYTLSPANGVPQGQTVDWRLGIEEPIASGGLDTNRVVAMPAPREVKYVANLRWIDSAPRMIQTLLVQSFEGSGRIRVVERQNVGARSDYVLKTEIREFEAQYFSNTQTPNVHVRILAKLVRLPRESLVDLREFEASVTAKSGRSADLVAAFDEALGRVMADMVGWTLAAPAASAN